MPRKRIRRKRAANGLNPALRDAMLEVVDNQLRDDNPKEVRRTLDRLLSQGHSERHARLLIATVVLITARDMLRDETTFDEAAYESALKQLPHLPL